MIEKPSLSLQLADITVLSNSEFLAIKQKIANCHKTIDAKTHRS